MQFKDLSPFEQQSLARHLSKLWARIASALPDLYAGCPERFLPARAIERDVQAFLRLAQSLESGRPREPEPSGVDLGLSAPEMSGLTYRLWDTFEGESGLYYGYARFEEAIEHLFDAIAADAEAVGQPGAPEAISRTVTIYQRQDTGELDAPVLTAILVLSRRKALPGT